MEIGTKFLGPSLKNEKSDKVIHSNYMGIEYFFLACVCFLEKKHNLGYIAKISVSSNVVLQYL